MSLKRIPKPVIIVLSAIVLCLALYIVFNMIFSPYWDSVYAPMGYFSLASMRQAEPADTIYTKKQACDDLDYLVKFLGRVHPYYIDGVSDDINTLLQNKKDSFGEEVSTYELWRSAAEIASKADDPETLVMPSFAQNYLVDYINKLNSGYTPVSVNKVKITQMLQDNSQYFSFDSETKGLSLITALFQSREGYTFLNIDTENLSVEYISPNGTTILQTYSDKDFYPYEEAVNMIEVQPAEPYTSIIEDEKNYGLITINTCEYDSDYKKFVYEFFGEVTSKGIENVIIDLSNASTGSSQVADEIIMYLPQDTINTPGGKLRMGPYLMKWDGETQRINHYDDMLFDGQVYLVISEKTSSSGTIAAEMFIDNGLAISIGTPCGSIPQCCGDVAVFQTPNAALSFQVSTKCFDRIDQSKSELPLEPDFICDSEETLDKAKEFILKLDYQKSQTRKRADLLRSTL